MSPIFYSKDHHDPVVHRWVLNALNTDGPADPGYRPSCYL
ncbi:hypothetical protein M2368_002560 [Arthrobacter sp. JUb119]|nr:hypothetical protein [Arthrobacter sp. JUb119]